MDSNQKQWAEWLADFRQRLIKERGWTEKEAKLRIRDAWVIVRDGRIHVLTKDAQRPADAVPIFEVRTPSGWKRPIEITDRLTGLIGKAMTSQRSPRDIVLGLLDLANHAEGQDESAEIKQKRDKAAFWICQLLDACEDKGLAGVVGSNVFWQVPMSAFQAGYHHAILNRYRDQELLADLIKAQAFQGGRGPDELSRCLEASWVERQAVLKRDPTPQEVFKAAGGVWSPIDDCWDFEGLKAMPSIPTGALYDRLDKIRRKYSSHP